MKELKYKIKRTKRKYYLYTKYYERVLNVKNDQAYKKIEKLRKEIFILKNKNNSINTKDYTPRVNIKNENPVVTQEKEKERLLHRTVVSNIIHEFCIKNY